MNERVLVFALLVSFRLVDNGYCDYTYQPVTHNGPGKAQRRGVGLTRRMMEKRFSPDPNSNCDCNGRTQLNCESPEEGLSICSPHVLVKDLNNLPTFIELCDDGNKTAYDCINQKPSHQETCCSRSEMAPNPNLAPKLTCSYSREGKSNKVRCSCTIVEDDSTFDPMDSSTHDGTEMSSSDWSTTMSESTFQDTTKASATQPTYPKERSMGVQTTLPTSGSTNVYLSTDTNGKTTGVQDTSATPPTSGSTNVYFSTDMTTAREIGGGTGSALSRRRRIGIAVGVPLALIFLLAALVTFFCWKKGGKRIWKSHGNVDNSPTLSVGGDGEDHSSITRGNPTYGLDERGVLVNDVKHHTSLVDVNEAHPANGRQGHVTTNPDEENAGDYTEIPSRGYEVYRPNQHQDTNPYAALNNGGQDDEDPQEYTPIPKSSKPTKGKIDSDYVEADTVLPQRGGGSTVPLRAEGLPNQNKSRKSCGYVGVDAPPVVNYEEPASPVEAKQAPGIHEAGQVSNDGAPKQVCKGTDARVPEGIYYFKIEEPIGESDQELTEESGAYDSFGRNALNVVIQNAPVCTGNNYSHIEPNMAHIHANNTYDTVDRTPLKGALKSEVLPPGAKSEENVHNTTTFMNGKDAAYDVIERTKHPTNTTDDDGGDYNIAMPAKGDTYEMLNLTS